MGNCSTTTKSKMSSTVKLDARLVFSLDFERAPVRRFAGAFALTSTPSSRRLLDGVAELNQHARVSAG